MTKPPTLSVSETSKLEGTDGSTSAGVSKAERPSIALLIPWSCREGFTNDVCGLPGDKYGCWRYRETALNHSVDDKGIKPRSFDEVHADLVAWIVFESPLDGSAIEARVEATKPVFDGSHHQAVFGFTKAGLDAFRKKESGDYPNYVQFLGSREGLEKEVNIKNWLREKNDEEDLLGLSDCFGQFTFVPQKIRNEAFKLNDYWTLSELIRSYLNHNHDCRFRREESVRGVGITMCKVGVELSKTPVLVASDETTEDEAEDLLSASQITFSYVDTESRTLKKLPQWSIGNQDVVVGGYLRTLSDDYFVPLHVGRDQAEEGFVNFASSLSRGGRRNVLPSEVGKSFLSFSMGEISAYLLHWLLLRIFAASAQSDQFIKSFDRWRQSLIDPNSPHASYFNTLLNEPVVVPVDRNIFKDAVRELNEAGRDFAVYEKPIAFGEALEFLGLSKANRSERIHATFKFLTRFFNPDTSDQSFKYLPMYRNLDWAESLLTQLYDSSSEADKIEAAIACMANASGITTEENRKELATEELRKHSERCVFPIADVLANRPYWNELPFYYIFPLWEETIRDDLSRPSRRPVIFAHVFTRALRSSSEVTLPSEKEILTIGEQLQSALLPAGAAIAHDFYNRERKRIERSDQERRTAWTQARAWAHEVKNYTSPIITDLGHPALSDVQNVSEDARVIIARARRAMLILNAASKAIQLAISKLANTAKTDEELEELPHEYAREIVEAVLQYLLNYRVETLGRSFLIKWEPHYDSAQAIERLSKILRAIRKTLDSQDIERTILGDRVIIGVIALLREVIGNIRMDSPYESPGVIDISYSFINGENDSLILDLVQHQVETIGGEEFPDDPPGVKMANELLGENCAKFGSIKTIKTESIPRPNGKGIDVYYRVQIKFALSKKGYVQSRRSWYESTKN